MIPDSLYHFYLGCVENNLKSVIIHTPNIKEFYRELIAKGTIKSGSMPVSILDKFPLKVKEGMKFIEFEMDGITIIICQLT